jgi:hypothetical protein
MRYNLALKYHDQQVQLFIALQLKHRIKGD